MRHIKMQFQDNEFNKLRNMKEANVILGKCSSWEDFILRLAKIRQSKEGGKK